MEIISLFWKIALGVCIGLLILLFLIIFSPKFLSKLLKTSLILKDDKLKKLLYRKIFQYTISYSTLPLFLTSTCDYPNCAPTALDYFKVYAISFIFYLPVFIPILVLEMNMVIHKYKNHSD